MVVSILGECQLRCMSVNKSVGVSVLMDSEQPVYRVILSYKSIQEWQVSATKKKKKSLIKKYYFLYITEVLL